MKLKSKMFKILIRIYSYQSSYVKIKSRIPEHPDLYMDTIPKKLNSEFYPNVDKTRYLDQNKKKKNP